MFIFSKDGHKVVNSDMSKRISTSSSGDEYVIDIDGIVMGRYTIEDDAVKELHEIIRQIEAGMASYQLR